MPSPEGGKGVNRVMAWVECSRQRKQMWESRSGKEHGGFTEPKGQRGPNVACEGKHDPKTQRLMRRGK